MSGMLVGKYSKNPPKGISISSAIPSIPMNVNATTVTTGIVAHPKSDMRVNGSAKRYRVTHCFKWMLSVVESRQELKAGSFHHNVQDTGIGVFAARSIAVS
jgi:hypothetical protein